MIKEVYNKANRGLKVFGRSLFTMMGIDLPVSDHSTFSKCDKAIPFDVI
jgi:hypothetical protein